MCEALLYKLYKIAANHARQGADLRDKYATSVQLNNWSGRQALTSSLRICNYTETHASITPKRGGHFDGWLIGQMQYHRGRLETVMYRVTAATSRQERPQPHRMRMRWLLEVYK